MYRKLLCSMFVMVIAISFVAADEFTATITSVKDGKVTYQKYKKAEKKGEKGEKDGDPVTMTVSDKATIAKGKGLGKGKFEAGDKYETGLKDDVFGKIDEKKGLPARITTEGDGDAAKITQILVIQQKKKKDTTN